MQISKTNITHLLLALAAALFLANGAIADTVSIFNTGVDASSNPLPFGSVDPHWSIVSSPDGTGPAAYVPTSYPSPWHPNSATATWIAPSPDQSLPGNSIGIGLYDYQTTFSLSGFNASTASLSGLVSTDNKLMDVLINGVSTGITNGNEDFGAAPQAFSISSGFVDGTNTLDFIVRNGGFDPYLNPPYGGPTGLFVDDLIGTACVPEPGTIVLLGLGALVVVIARKRSLRIA